MLGIGKFDKRITIAKKQLTSDGLGGYTSFNGGVYSRWANVKENSYKRISGDNAILHVNSITFIIRKLTISTDWFVNYNDLEYFIYNVYSDEKYTYIECQLK